MLLFASLLFRSRFWLCFAASLRLRGAAARDVQQRESGRPESLGAPRSGPMSSASLASITRKFEVEWKCMKCMRNWEEETSEIK